MYTPLKFNVEDPTAISSFVEENAFGLILSIDGDDIHDTHTPFIYSEDKRHLLGHLAKANPHWKSWKEGTRAKVIFTGPHSYISPKYYVSEFAVPTWNYTAVSITGQVRILEKEDDVLHFLDRLIAVNESSDNPWALDRNDERYMKLLSGIIVFSVSISFVEASFKMNQNKSEEDQRKVIGSLSATGCPFDRDVAQIMKQNMTNAEQKN
jgi:transcriptional regulator